MADELEPLPPLNAHCEPWQSPAMATIASAAARGRVSHALLVTGLPGTGLRGFAEALAVLLTCVDPVDGAACGRCRSCQLNQAGTHPDVVRLHPEKAGSDIRIGQVREAIEFGHQTALRGGRRVLLIAPAEAMNDNAANSLLKLLEEPGPDFVIILQCYRPSALLPTIRSRCQLVTLPVPAPAAAIDWVTTRIGDRLQAEEALAATPQRPLAALRLHQSGQLRRLTELGASLQSALAGQETSAALAAAWEAAGAERSLAGVYRWLLGRARASLLDSAQDPDGNANRWLDAAALVVDARRELTRGNNANQSLLLQVLAQRMIRCLASPG